MSPSQPESQVKWEIFFLHLRNYTFERSTRSLLALVCQGHAVSGFQVPGLQSHLEETTDRRDGINLTQLSGL